MKEKETIEFDNILENLKSEKDLIKHLDSTLKAQTSQEFQNYFLNVLKEKKKSKAEIINEANISKSYGYQIFDGSRKPSRDTIIKLCIVSKFTQKETERALTLGGVGKLYSKLPRDFIILYCIKTNRSLMDTNILLDDQGEPPLE